jgi:5-methylcytosine-specific restriction protein A
VSSTPGATYRILQVPEGVQGGDWATGYHRHVNDWFIFAAVGAAGRTGHDYANRWDGDELVWRGKTQSRVDTPSVQSLLSPAVQVFIFTREHDCDP